MISHNRLFAELVIAGLSGGRILIQRVEAVYIGITKEDLLF